MILANIFRLASKTRSHNEGAQSVIAIVEQLLSIQLVLEHQHFRKAFSTLMMNRVAAGYVFGFHDSCFQIFGLANSNSHAADAALFETSYKHIFGDQAGFALFQASLGWQTDREFQIGRQSGGEDFADFKRNGTPPLGLQRIITLGFNAEMVERTLDNPQRATAQPSGSNRQPPKAEQEQPENREDACAIKMSDSIKLIDTVLRLPISQSTRDDLHTYKAQIEDGSIDASDYNYVLALCKRL